MKSSYNQRRWLRGFTLVELLVASAILGVVMVLVAQMIGDTSKLWKRTSAKIDAFRQARLGFELMTNELKAATTNTYYDYFNSSGQTVAQFNALGGSSPFSPAAYGRQSDLHFISGPSAVVRLGLPTGTTGGPYTHSVFFTWAGGFTSTAGLTTLNSLLNQTGFFIEYSADALGVGATPYFTNGPPTSILTKYPITSRFRLVQYVQPTEIMGVYNYGLVNATDPNSWFNSTTAVMTPCSFPGHEATCRVVANNVIALVIWPKKTDTINDLYVGATPPDTTPLSPTYSFDSRNGLKSGSATTGGTTPWTPGVGAQPLQMNQMAPILNVAMVSIDEPSAVLIQSTYNVPPPKVLTAISTGGTINSGKPLFQVASPLYSGSQNVSNMDLDLQQLEANLSAVTPRLNFQVFKTTIAIRSAKFAN